MSGPSQADMKQQLDEFFDYAQADGGQIQLGVAYTENGWRVILKVGQKAMTFAPGWGRGFVRGVRARAEAEFKKMPPAILERVKPDQIRALWDSMEDQCKEAMRLQRAGATPADVSAPIAGSA